MTQRGRSVSECIRAYQIQLEMQRAGAGDPEELAEDLAKARREMEVAWLEAANAKDWTKL